MDLVKRLKVVVTSKNIEDAEQVRNTELRCDSCPIALAIKGQGIDVLFCVGVTYTKTWFDTDQSISAEYYDHSRAAIRFIRRFDRCKPVQPSTFVLTLYTQ